MKTLKIVVYILKNEFRNKQAVIFSLMLPIVLLILMGTTDKAQVGYFYPGIVAIAFGTMGLVGISSQITGYLERDVFKRIIVTDQRIGSFILMDCMAQVLFMGIQFILITVVARLGYNAKFDIDVKYFSLMIVEIVLGMISLMSIGVIIGGIAKNTKTASTIGNAVMVVMLFVGNTLFPSDGWPKIIRVAAKYLPMNNLTDAMRRTLILHTVRSSGIFPNIMSLSLRHSRTCIRHPSDRQECSCDALNPAWLRVSDTGADDYREAYFFTKSFLFIFILL